MIKLYIILIFLVLWTMNLLPDNIDQTDSLYVKYGILGKSITHIDSIFTVDDCKTLVQGDSIKINYKFPSNSTLYIFVKSSSNEIVLNYKSNDVKEQVFSAEEIKSQINWFEVPKLRDKYTIVFLLVKDKNESLEMVMADYRNSNFFTKKKRKNELLKTLNNIIPNDLSDKKRLTTKLSPAESIGAVFRNSSKRNEKDLVYYVANGDQLVFKEIDFIIK